MAEAPTRAGDRRTATVRFRTTAMATAAVAVMLAVTAVALVAHQRRVLTESLDEALALEANALRLQVPAPPATLDGVIDDDGVAQIVVGDNVVAATANLTGRPPLATPPDDGRATRAIGGVLPGEPAFRVLSRQVSRGTDNVVVHVGASMEDIDETTASLSASLAVTVPAVAAALAVLVWVLVGRTLAPVEGIRAEVAAIGASDLYRRVPVPGTDDEVGRLARTMNDMLDRLEDASRRQQQFVADASHELRSPLTRIRSEIEVDLADPDRADAFATLRSVLADATDLERLADDLLVLARADAGATTLARRAVDLDDIVLRHVRRWRAKEQIALDAGAVSAAQVLGDDRQLTRAVGNLIDNAVRHAASVVTITLAEHDDHARLTVADDGPGIPPDQREQVFERFTRIDDARTRAAGGAGLGLAITRDIVERHGGTITVDADHAPGARFVVRLPLADA